MARDGLLADAQLGRDTPIRLTGGDQRDDLVFTPAQRAVRLRGAGEPTQPLEIGRGAKGLEPAARRFELELGGRGIAERATRDCDQEPYPRDLVGRREITPRTLCGPQFR